MLRDSLTKAAIGDWLKVQGHFFLVAWRLPQLLKYLLWIHKNSAEPKQARRTHLASCRTSPDPRSQASSRTTLRSAHVTGFRKIVSTRC